MQIRSDFVGVVELPPHTRRRVLRVSLFTSRAWNYLRIRGEEKRSADKRLITAELPPHTRRRE